MPTQDVVVIGGGIVGLATLFRLQQRYPRLRTALLEKEPDVGRHQTGHNSGVLHSGIYYKPGSQKAINCRLGKQAMEAFCREHGIAYETCGKVIVATGEDELPLLERIHERGQQNGVNCQRIGPERLRELEPHATGLAAIHVPEAGIVDYGQVVRQLAHLTRGAGSELVMGARVTAIETHGPELVVRSTAGEWTTRYVINCAGLHSDRVTRLAGHEPQARIVPFRGEYYLLKPSAYRLCRTLIYPVPDPNFPFLGVHFTKRVNGTVECGPNAVLAFAREGYRKTDVNLRDLAESLSYGGFLRLAARYWRVGAAEMWRSFSKPAFVRALQKLVPDIRASDLLDAPAGVRAQAVARDGSMVDDFSIVDEGSIIHVGNAPSPAATSSLQIGQTIVERFATRL
jgi:L-2-hydroxyglutarate oxidase